MATKRVVCVHLGRETRNLQHELTLPEGRLVLETVSTGGDLSRAEGLIGQLDGHVDALAFAGAPCALVDVDGRRRVPRFYEKLRERVRNTPVFDGSLMEGELEQLALDALAELRLDLTRCRALMLCATEWDAMRRALSGVGISMVYGDAFSFTRLPRRISEPDVLYRAQVKRIALVCKTPWGVIYPLDARAPGYPSRFFEDVNVVAGDAARLERCARSDCLTGRVLLAPWATREQQQVFTAAGAYALVTLTPSWMPQGCGPAEVEAALACMAAGTPAAATREMLAEKLAELDTQLQTDIMNAPRAPRPAPRPADEGGENP